MALSGERLRALVWAALLLLAVAAGAVPGTPPGARGRTAPDLSVLLPPRQPPPQKEAVVVLAGSPDLHLRLAVQWVSLHRDLVKDFLVRGHGDFDKEDLPYVRFISLWKSPRDLLPVHRALLQGWLNQMTFSQEPGGLREVPGSAGSLFWIDVRDWDTNPDAWQAIAERDRYLCEPWVDHKHAEFLRMVTGARLSAAAQKGREVAVGAGRTEVKAILPAVAVADGLQLLRDTMESNRVPSYYDFAFGKFRFPGGTREVFVEQEVLVTERVTVEHKGGDFTYPDGRVAKDVRPGLYYYDRQTVKTELVRKEGVAPKFADFPRDRNDFEKAFGVDLARKFSADNAVDLDFGWVTEGGQDRPDGVGSFVTLHNRLTAIRRAFAGEYMESFDTDDPTGAFDYVESLIFGGKAFVKGQGIQTRRKFGEYLAYTPNGGMLCLLTAQDDKRAELAGNDVAHNQASTTMDVRVLNAADCHVCHGPEGGFIPPRNALNAEQMRRAFRRENFRDEGQYRRLLAFFDPENAGRMKTAQDRYLRLIERTTGGWTGARWAREIEAFQKWYDAPVTLPQAALEVGCTVEQMVGFLEASPLVRARLLAAGVPCPRRTWEVDLYPNVQLIREALVQEDGAAVFP